MTYDLSHAYPTIRQELQACRPGVMLKRITKYPAEVLSLESPLLLINYSLSYPLEGYTVFLLLLGYYNSLRSIAGNTEPSSNR